MHTHSGNEAESEDDDDAQYYREEVGEEPEPELFSKNRRSTGGRGHGVAGKRWAKKKQGGGGSGKGGQGDRSGKGGGNKGVKRRAGDDGGSGARRYVLCVCVRTAGAVLEPIGL